MSRIGKKPISFPTDVSVTISGTAISVKGPKGSLSMTIHPNMSVEIDEASRVVRVNRPSDSRENRALHGLTRSLVQNMVTGVSTPFERRLVIVGVGYNARISGNKIALQVGYANTVELAIPPSVTCEVPDPTRVLIRGADKQVVGQFAAEIRNVRPPEPYKGKGIRYENEYVRRKAGKAFGSK
ncbi:MAG: 50S ribosomal protein L6 [Planctomycetaceae bacterium]